MMPRNDSCRTRLSCWHEGTSFPPLLAQSAESKCLPPIVSYSTCRGNKRMSIKIVSGQCTVGQCVRRPVGEIPVINKLTDETTEDEILDPRRTEALSPIPFKNQSNMNADKAPSHIFSGASFHRVHALLPSQDCTSASISILSNVSQLDVNGDGQWTEQEAIDLDADWEDPTLKNIPTVSYNCKNYCLSQVASNVLGPVVRAIPESDCN
eukprot:3378279-Amphidinium_carterae.1